MAAGGDDDVFLFPLSYAQERLWFMDQLVPGNPLFNLNTAVRLCAAVDVAVLRQSLAAMVERHESLRTVFGIFAGKPMQIVSQGGGPSLDFVDLRRTAREQREVEARRLVAMDAAAPFDLTQGPLLRLTLVRLDEADYVLSLTMHHIVSDGWSLGLFWKELSVFWSAFAAGTVPELPELVVQYGDFAVWQRERLPEVLDEQLGYWRDQLDAVPVLNLPTDRPRPAVQSFEGATLPIAIDPALTSAVRALSRREGVTPFMTLLTAFVALLARYSGQDDIVVGSYIAGRNREELEPLIGFFLNTLVLRADLGGNPTFREALARVRRMTLDAYSNQDVPFAKLVEELQPERDLSRNPLFQVVFQMINVPTLVEREGQESSLVEVGKHTSIFDLTCTLWESGDGLRGHFEYCTDLFDPESVSRLGGHYQVLLGAAVEDPERSVGDLPLMSDEEHVEQLVNWNDTRVERDLPSIPELFEGVAAACPDAVAYRFHAELLTYGELRLRADRLAGLLRGLGVGPETLVAICIERSFDFVVALLAVMRAGGAYLPLDPAYPAERLRFMLEDSRATIVVTKDGSAAAIAGDDVRIIDIGDPLPDAEPPALEPPAPGALAYVIYTSGSTGTPRGVAVPHEQVLNRLAWMWEAYPWRRHEVACQKTALSFVDSIWELLGGLLQGIPTVIVGDDVLRDPAALVRTLAEHRVTRIWVVPSFLRMVLDAHPDLAERLPTLTFWVTSGEAIPVELYERFAAVMPDAVLHNVYGTSEFWDATWYDPGRGPTISSRVPIGTPISNVEVFVLDDMLRPVPVGVEGQLYVGGCGLARGYLNDPVFTRERFIAHPFDAKSGSRLYRTGDVVRFLADGVLEYVGRRDHQVKVRGFRVELAEVESVLARHPDVREAAVARVEGSTPDDATLTAWVVPRRETLLDDAELRRYMRVTLPLHMIPASFCVVDALPLTPSGKTNRKALLTAFPARNSRRVAADFVPPRSATQRTVAAIWKEVLGVDRVGADDSFFDLGGHSLLLFQAYIQLRSLVDCELSMTDMFRYPTVATLAERVDASTLVGSGRADR